MKNQVFRTLEFDKILSMLSSYAVMELTKKSLSEPKVCDNIKKVNKMQDETAEALTLITKKGSPPIMCTLDVRSSLKRARMSGVLSISEILSVGKVLETSRRLKDYPDDIEAPSLEEHFEALWENKDLEKRIFQSIADEENLADDASSELADIRRKIRVANNKVRDTLRSIISSPAYAKCLQEQIITMRDDRYVVPVKAEHKGEIKGIVHDTSATGATLFIEPMSVVEANNEIRTLMDRERDEIVRILSEFSAHIANDSELIEMTYGVISELDHIFARAHFSLRYDCYRPILNDKGIIKLDKARHLLIDAKKVVPVDIRLGDGFDTLVVTGPNTGGKTVVLKTAGLITLMAQAGLHIPAREGSVVAVFKNIFADIGDEQSIEQSLSTFSSHMVNIVEILKTVDENSLCLFDELGAGTDPIEGASLAVSILERVRLMGAKTMATTHYSELKTYALGTDGVENASCEFDVDTLAPTYRLLIGIPGKSNAFAISKRLGIDDDIIQQAKSYIAGENIKFEDILSELEKSRREAIDDKERAEHYKTEAERLKEDTAQKKKRLEEKTEKILERARAEAREILEQAKRDSEELLSEIRKTRQIKDNKKAQQEADKVRASLNKKISDNNAKLSKLQFKPQDESKAPKTVKCGDDVEIVTLRQQGVVCSLPDDNGNLFVKVGIMKVKTNIKDLKLLNVKKPQKQKGSSANTFGKTMNLSPEIDVRGETVDSAELLIDKFLDDAVLSSVGVVRIIHGKGTGLLRKGIHAFLKTRPYVKSYRLGVFGEGDAGVTVVELK